MKKAAWNILSEFRWFNVFGCPCFCQGNFEIHFPEGYVNGSL